MFRRLSYIGFTAILAVLIVAGCGKEKFEEAPKPIMFIVVAKEGALEKKVYSGISKNITESKISFRVDGAIEYYPIKVGQAVEKGEVLARLDPTDFQTKVDAKKAEFISSEADLKRYRLLYEEESATKQELDKAQANHDVAKAQYEFSQQELSYAVLKAPNKGLIVSTDVELHENVTVGQTVCVLETGKELEVKVGLPERLIGQVRKGDKVQVHFESIVDKQYDAKVTEVGVRIDEKTATFPVTVEIVGQHEGLRAGMVADVEFSFETPRTIAGMINIPANAVLEDPDGKTYVWVYEEDEEDKEETVQQRLQGTVHRRDVEVGELTENGIEITGGLEPGDVVASAGAAYLQEGQKVSLMRKL